MRRRSGSATICSVGSSSRKRSLPPLGTRPRVGGCIRCTPTSCVPSSRGRRSPTRCVRCARGGPSPRATLRRARTASRCSTCRARSPPTPTATCTTFPAGVTSLRPTRSSSNKAPDPGSPAISVRRPAAEDGTRESTHRMWFRVPTRLPDDGHLHTALLGFATDWTGIGGRPLHLEGDITGMVSLDHAAWFHRPARRRLVVLRRPLARQRRRARLAARHDPRRRRPRRCLRRAGDAPHADRDDLTPGAYERSATNTARSRAAHTHSVRNCAACSHASRSTARSGLS